MVHREDAEQRALVQWADHVLMPGAIGGTLAQYLFAIPNGGARGKIEAARMIGLGVRAGVADLFLSFPVGMAHGLYIEMKAPKPYRSRVTDKQADFLNRMEAVGYRCFICYGWDEARHAIEEYLG